MRFDDYVWQHQVPEWHEYYINYHILNQLLEVAYTLFENMLIANNFDNNFDPSSEAMQKVNKIDELFSRTLNDQILLFDDFMHYKFDITIKRRFVLIVYNIKEFAVRSMTPQERKEAKKTLKTFMMKFYKALHITKEFIELNTMIFHKLTGSYKRVMSLFKLYNQQKGVRLNEMFKNTRVVKIGQQLDYAIKLLEDSILVNFYRSDNYQRGHIALAKLAGNNQFSNREAWLMGLYVGLCLMCIFVVGLLMIETDFFSEKQSDFITYQFPIFRGTLLLFVYITMIGLDVYIWERWNIDFKKAFDIQLLSTNAFRIFMVGFAFLAIWMLTFIYCGLSNSENLDFEGRFFNASVSAYFPPFVWVIFILFMLFPSRRLLFGKARLFVWQSFKSVLKAPFRVFSFLDYVFLDQLTSFVTIFKDFAYTWCYFVNLIQSGGDMRNTCDKYPFKIAYIVLTVIPLFWKCFLITNRYYFIISRRKSNRNFRRDLKYVCINAFRLIVALTTSFFSFFSYESEAIFFTWLGLSILSAIVMYLGDLYIEWGFFIDGGFRLRRLTAFRKRWIYYLVMVLNLGLRYSWAITISPSFYPSLVVRSIVITFVAIIEMARRMLWNVFKVEYEHIKYVGNFFWMNEENVPFPAKLNMADPQTNKLVNYQFDRHLDPAYFNKEIENCPNGLSSIDDQLLRFVNGEQINLTKKMSFVSQISNHEYYFIEEKDERTGLIAYNKSLSDCMAFINEIKPQLHKTTKKERYILSSKNLEPCYVNKVAYPRNIVIDGDEDRIFDTSVFDPRENAIILPSPQERSMSL